MEVASKVRANPSVAVVLRPDRTQIDFQKVADDCGIVTKGAA